jgi:hypothetical protein
MGNFVLTSRATIMCPHGGSATVTPTAVRVAVDGDPPLRLGDVSTVAGCPFTVGSAPSPCVRIEWTMPAARVTIEGAAPLTHASVGLCMSGASAPQGTALITGFQTRVTAQ